jgi:hypothetical protein
VDRRNGKFLSHIAFADFDGDFARIQRVSDQTVIPLGGLGCFDEHGIFPINVLPHAGRVLAYTCGWSRRVSVSVETAIGLAVSDDGGLTFQRHGLGPVLGPSPREPFLVGDGFVKVIAGVFHMWYIFGTGWRRFDPAAAPERTYKIGHATSPDGVNWTKAEGQRVVPDVLGPDECQALPSVVQIGRRYHMFFCYRHSTDFRKNAARGYRIGHAYSDDLCRWTRDDAAPALAGSPGAWDSDMQCYPHAFENRGQVYLLYNGNEFGRHGFGLARLET